MRSLTYLWLLWMLPFAAALGEPIRATLSSQFLVRGEQAVLQYPLPRGVDPRSAIEPPTVDGVTIRQVGYTALPNREFRRTNEYAFRFQIVSYQPGNYTIPPARIDTGQGIVETEEISFQVIRETDLSWDSADTGQGTFRYSAAFHTTEDSPYVNEVIPVELKIYLPDTEQIEDWGVPEFERNGVAAWRFEPRPEVSRVELPGGRFFAISYPSTLSPLRGGQVSLGPSTLRLITVQTSLNRFSEARYQPVNLSIPPIELNARPLPKDAPEGFTNAVGQFAMDVSAMETEVREGDPVTLSLSLSGWGNLDSLDPPTLQEPDGWKVYPPSRVQSPERRERSGTTIFRQFLRPERMSERVPPFRFVYFDPEAEEFRTLISESIPLEVFPSTQAPALGSAVPPAQPMPLEEMTDILGILPTTGTSPAAWPKSLSSAWQWIPLALVLGLVIRIFQLHLMPRVKPDPDRQARQKDLRQVSASPGDPREFYRRAGAFVEKWLGDSPDPLPREVLVTRDEICFTKEVPSSSLPSRDRQRILRGLRKLALPLLMAGVLWGTASDVRAEETSSPPPSPTAEQAFQDSRFSEAADLWLNSAPWDQLSADTLYNIGDASYRLGSPGEAALYWRRALLKDDRHAEARQNLRFLERKFGSITLRRPDYQYSLSKLSQAAWKNTIFVGAWLGVLGCLIFPATRTGSKLRIAGVIALASAPLLATVGWLGNHYYPDDALFAEARQQGVIIADRAEVRTDAARNAPLVIEAPAGSLCRLLHTTGDWSYVAFTNETRGWVPSGQVSPVVVDERPEAPSRPSLQAPGDKNA